jgi:hypothetical protein
MNVGKTRETSSIIWFVFILKENYALREAILAQNVRYRIKLLLLNALVKIAKDTFMLIVLR